jgi:hypothetical protein
MIACGQYFSHETTPVYTASASNAVFHRLPAAVGTPESNAETLQFECLKTKPESCFGAGWNFRDQMDKLATHDKAERDSLEARSIALWRRGCLLGMHSSCDSLIFLGAQDDAEFSKAQLKTHCDAGAQGSCTILAKWLIRDPKTRDTGEGLLANQCKHLDEDACEGLGQVQIQVRETQLQGVTSLQKLCNKGRVSSCGLLISLYADTHPEFSESLIAKVENTCRLTHGISACEYLADLYTGETDARFKDLERAVPLQTQLCNLGITHNCAALEKLTPPPPPKKQALNDAQSDM